MLTGDALLNQITASPEELTLQLAFRDWCGENPEYMELCLKYAVRKLSDLTASGVGIPFRQDETEDDGDRRFDSERTALFESVDAFAVSLAWLATRGRRRSVDRGRDSYNYKHDVERVWGDTDHPVYVPQGSLIAAAIVSGFPWRVVPGDLSVMIGISRRTGKKRGA